MYGCVNFLNEQLIYMASLFSPHIVYFQKPDGVLSKAMAQFATGITVECGLPGLPEELTRYMITYSLSSTWKSCKRFTRALRELMSTIVATD